MADSPDFYEFGPFRLEVSSRSLYRDGEFVPVTPKAFDTLCVLVEEAGRVVTKDELLQRVWPDAFVEEGSIANNISLLRKIFHSHYGDDGPIATVSRRGYRFTAPVTLRNAAAGIAVVADSGELDADALKAIEDFDNAEPAPIGLSPAHSPIRLLAHWPAAMAAAMLIAAALGIFTLTRPAPTEAAASSPLRRSVAVLPLKNLSGQDEYAWFSTALAESINTELGAGGQLRLISGNAVAQMQQDLKPQPGVALSRKQLDEIGRSLGADLLLTGSYMNKGGRVTVDMRLDDISTGAPVASLSVSEAEGKLLDLVATASRELRAKMGLAPPMPGQSASARASLSSNPNALRYYFVGLEALRIHDIARSTELLTQATLEDPDFALAHSVLSISWRVLGHDSKSQAEAKKAFDLAGKLSREDQLAVEGAYYEVMSDWAKAIEKYQSLWNFFPDNIAYGIKLEYQQQIGGRLEDARRTIEQMRQLPPPADTDPRVDQVETYLNERLGRYDDMLRTARSWADKARLRKSNQLLATSLLMQGRATLALGDIDRSRALFKESRELYEKLGDEAGVGQVLRIDSLALATRGDFTEAKTLLDRALQIATSINHQRLLPDVYASRSAVLLQLQQPKPAKSDAEMAVIAFRAVKNRAGLARALTALGSAQTSQRDFTTARTNLEEAERLGREIGEPPVFTDAMNALAQLDLAEGRIADARRRMDEILPIDRRTGDKGALTMRLATLSAVMQGQGQVEQAASVTTEECSIYRALSAKSARAECEGRLARLTPARAHLGESR